MIVLTLLVVLSAIFQLWFKKFLNLIFAGYTIEHQEAECEYNRSYSEGSKLKTSLALIEKNVEETVALYDITKRICKSLGEDKVIKEFLESINRHMVLDDCRFLDKDSDLSQYPDYILVPLVVDKHKIGCLAAKGIRQEDVDKFKILSEQFVLGIKRAYLYKKVQELAITDSLTAVFSRRYLMERLYEEIQRSAKFGYRFAFLMIDVDRFKDYNDHYGHLVGDAILKEVSKTIKENIRQIDLVGRYGGEEFSIILTETGGKEAAYAAERIRQAIENRRIKIYDEELRATLSIGVAVFPKDASEAGEIIEAADKALYRAKGEGRNKVCFCADKS